MCVFCWVFLQLKRLIKCMISRHERFWQVGMSHFMNMFSLLPIFSLPLLFVLIIFPFLLMIAVLNALSILHLRTPRPHLVILIHTIRFHLASSSVQSSLLSYCSLIVLSRKSTSTCMDERLPTLYSQNTSYFWSSPFFHISLQLA